jgi:hypothetical protein
VTSNWNRLAWGPADYVSGLVGIRDMGDETEDEADHAHVDHQGVEQEDPDDR